MEDANKKCGNIRRDSYSTESACRRGVAWWRNSEPCLNRTLCRNNRLSPSTGHLNFVSVRHKWDEAVYCEGFVVLYCAASSVDSITDYNEFSPCRSREVYLTFLFKSNFLFNCIISLIFILVFYRLSVH